MEKFVDLAVFVTEAKVSPSSEHPSLGAAQVDSNRHSGSDMKAAVLKYKKGIEEDIPRSTKIQSNCQRIW